MIKMALKLLFFCFKIVQRLGDPAQARRFPGGGGGGGGGVGGSGPPPKICIGGVQRVKDPPNKNGTCLLFISNINKITFLSCQIFLSQNVKNRLSQR